MRGGVGNGVQIPLFYSFFYFFMNGEAKKINEQKSPNCKPHLNQKGQPISGVVSEE